MITATLDSTAALLALPPQLEERRISLRPERDDDVPFLRDLYVWTRWEEMALSSWSEVEKKAFLHEQFRMQRQHYRNAYHDAFFSIVMHGDNNIGRLYVHRGPRDHRVVDISLLPGWRGHGIGGELMRCVQAEARGLGRRVSIHVESFNPARNLYRRLGFQEVEDKGIYILMEWTGPISAASVEPCPRA